MTLPAFPPMLAVPWDQPFSDPTWCFEPKLDGVRALTTIEAGSVTIRARSGRDISDTYPELADLVAVDDQTILDGEIVAYDHRGRPSFERLQGRIHTSGQRAIELAATVPIGYVVFDVLAVGGEVVIDQPLEARTARLAQLELPNPVVSATPIAGEGEALFEAIVAQGMEGIVAKRYGSPYRPGGRSPDWRKIPYVHRARALVGGFTPGEGGRSGTFGALLIGLWDGDRLRWAGAVGSGFDTGALRAIREALDQMRITDCPFHPDPSLPRDAVWVDPHLVAEIDFKEWTSSGRLRAPSFKGFSERQPEAVTWDTEGPRH